MIHFVMKLSVSPLCATVIEIIEIIHHNYTCQYIDTNMLLTFNLITFFMNLNRQAEPLLEGNFGAERLQIYLLT